MRHTQLCPIVLRGSVAAIASLLIMAVPSAMAQTEPRQDAEALTRIDAMFESWGGA